jgi:tetratricopeptide (TPR) repeat protein
MTIQPNDPRLTAYALAQLDPAEAAAFEELLAGDPPAQAAVAEIRRLGVLLRQARAAEPLPEGSPELTTRLQELAQAAPTGIEPAPAAVPPRPSRRRKGAILAAACALLLATTLVIPPLVNRNIGQWSVAQLWPGDPAGTPVQPSESRNTKSQALNRYGLENSPLPNDGAGFGDVGKKWAEDAGKFNSLVGTAPETATGSTAGRPELLEGYGGVTTRDVPGGGSAGAGGPGVPIGASPGGYGRGFGGSGGYPGARGPESQVPGGAPGYLGPPGNPGREESDFEDAHGRFPGGYDGARNFPLPQPATSAPDYSPPEYVERLVDGRPVRVPVTAARSVPGRPASSGEAPHPVPSGDTTKDENKNLEGDRTALAGEKPTTSEVLNEEIKRHKSDKGRSAEARPGTWRRAQLVPNASRLQVGEREELPLSALQTSVQIDGFRARVLVDLYFYNDQPRQLEGQFEIRLPNEASLYFFAFGETAYQAPQPGKTPVFFNVPRSRELASDPKSIMLARSESWQDPKEARIVPRERAAYAYRETVRRRVDPALVEWEGAGVFSARVFPLAPSKLHRIVIGYDMNLLETDSQWVYRLDLPEPRPQCQVDLHLAPIPSGKQRDAERADVQGGDQKPGGLPGDAKQGKPQDARWNHLVSPAVPATRVGDRLHYRFENPQQSVIEVRLPRPAEALALRGDDETGSYFATRLAPDLPVEATDAGPRDGIFLIDTSLSAQPERFNIYLKLLERMLTSNRPSMPRFGVLFFNVESHWWREELLPNTERNVAALLEYCHSLALEGATDLHQAAITATNPSWLQQPEKHKAAGHDYFLLSDGALTWGQRDLAQIAGLFQSTGGALFAYTTGLAGDDPAALAALARESGGALFALVGEDQVDKVAQAHRARPWQLIDVSLQGASDLLIAGRPKTVFPGQTLHICGRGQVAEGASLALTLRRANQDLVVREQLAHVLPTDLAPRAYGQIATAGLEELQSRTYDMAVAYARHFRVTGQTCSLLMLESEADYQRFNIKPEEDAFVVKSTPAGGVLAQVEQEWAQLRNDPKAAFVSWLDRLQNVPGVQLEIPPALRVAIEKLPRESFAVTAQPLACKLRTWQDLPGAFQDEQLSARPLSYDAFSAEALRRFNRAGADDALRAISSLVEFNPGDVVLLRDVGYNASEWGRGDQAYALFRRVALARPFEPQTYHALARCLAGMGRTDLALLYYEVAVTGTWDGRFGDFNQIVGLDYLRFLRQIEQGKLKTSLRDYAAARTASLDARYGLGQPDLVVTMAWNTDGTDVDMHVLEPTGEECFYQHRQTRIGGNLSTDVTQGFGPEMYVLRKAVPGQYKVTAHYFASDANRASTRTKVHVTITRDWGTKRETVIEKTVTLLDGKQTHDVASVIVE